MTDQALQNAAPAYPRKRAGLKLSRVGVYAFLIISVICFLIPSYVVIVTSIKPMAEIRLGNLLALPVAPTFEPWIKAWSSACTGLACNGVSAGFVNSWKIVIPSMVFSIALGAITGYAMMFWKPRGANFILMVLILGAFFPHQNYLFPFIRILSYVNLYSSIAGVVIVHMIFSMPILTLMFRNFYDSIPSELFKAARVDGAGFWPIFFYIMLPMSGPMFVVSVIITITLFWNDFIVGLIFAGHQNLPMTVQLNNIINNSTSGLEYNVNMAATIWTAMVPVLVYFVSGRWFVRGITAGAVKG